MTTSTLAPAPAPRADATPVTTSAARGPATTAPTAPASDPVFVDASGRRRRVAGRAVVATLLGVCGLVGLTVSSVASGTGAPVEWRPTSTAHVTPVTR